MEITVETAVIKNAGKRQLSRVKSSTRMRYEAEVGFLKKQNGDLEEIRARLGLSRRKICQLLMVDPSAWTRWTSHPREAPPHIYRALDWYLAIMEKDPEYRRLANRFAQWLNQEKDYAGRLGRLEALLTENSVEDPPVGRWRNLVAALIAFFGGMILVFFILRFR